MIDPGDRAPDFLLPGTDPGNHEEIREYNLSTTLDQRPVLVNFYVFDFHPACRKNVCELHDLSWFDLDTDVDVFGIATDSTFSHQEFARQESLDYPLLSDSDGSTAEAYGVLADELGGHRRVAQRSAFVIDRDQTVRYSWVADSPSQQPDWEVIKTAVDEIK